MTQNPMIVFVCEHGAAKSIVASVYFNKLAKEKGLHLRSVARGTHPDQELSPQTVKGLLKDGLVPKEPVPQKLSPADIRSAHRLITFCELPNELQQEAAVEHWDDVPPVSENYEQARDAILERINNLVRTLS
jgi:arsenate reductase